MKQKLLYIVVQYIDINYIFVLFMSFSAPKIQIPKLIIAVLTLF